MNKESQRKFSFCNIFFAIELSLKEPVEVAWIFEGATPGETIYGEAWIVTRLGNERRGTKSLLTWAVLSHLVHFEVDSHVS